MVPQKINSRFITFEGTEGCGKTTQLSLAEGWFREHGLPFIATAEPGGTSLGLKIREILLNRSSVSVSAEAELLLFTAARAQHVVETIIPALKSGKWVLCDRYTDATTAYQGFGRGIDAQFVQTVNRFSSRGMEPALTLLFDLPVKIGLARAQKRIAEGKLEHAEDRFEHEDLHFHNLVRMGYLRLADKEPLRFRTVNAVGTPEEIHAEVCRLLEAFTGVAPAMG